MTEASGKNCPENSWESVALELTMEAVVGRLFSGTIHNLNGVVQAFSMQVDLLQSMFQQCDELITHLKKKLADNPCLEELDKLDSLLKQRANLTAMLEDKVSLAQNILQRHTLPPYIISQKNEQSQLSSTVNEILSQEIDFLCADRFFKHQVDKQTRYDTTVPQISDHLLELHQVCFCLLDNSLIAMRLAVDENNGRGQLSIESAVTDEGVVITIQDSGIGISSNSLPMIYQPFFTTWIERKGLGLYYVKSICDRCGWKIVCTSKHNPTIFQLTLPE
jgi:signal transduction histidine kinase